jgi:SAM-dependent methyltransferase
VNGLPLPPIELMRSVGPTDNASYDNPGRLPVYGADFPSIDYSRVLEFGCGCGRVARQLLQQTEPPKEYFGIDLHRAAIEWCNQNLRRDGFRFQHADVFNPTFNPSGKPGVSPFPAPDDRYSFVLAHSVFTHVVERDVAGDLKECARVLSGDWVFRSTWFLFEKHAFPVMQEFQNALYINDVDPTNAVYFDREFVSNLFTAVGLQIVKVLPPCIRGFQYFVYARKSASPVQPEWPRDDAPLGIHRPPASLFIS